MAHRKSPASAARGLRAPRQAATPDANPYPVALGLVAGRELSTAQLASRLRRRGFGEPQIRDTIARLERDGALDDRRAALARARYGALVKHRGRLRTLRDVEAIGIDRARARAAVDEVFAEIDEAGLLDRALARRLKGRVTSPAEFRRLYQYLVRQGFDGHAAAAALRARSRPGVGDAEGEDVES